MSEASMWHEVIAAAICGGTRGHMMISALAAGCIKGVEHQQRG
jgi:hypothetical protein